MSLSIRPLRAEDIEDVLELWLALVKNGHDVDARFTPSENAIEHMRPWIRTAWLQTHPIACGWVASVDGELAGFLSAVKVDKLSVIRQPLTMRIGDLFVTPNHRRCGVGRALVENFESKARDAGVERFEVGTLAADERAVGFWKTMGFGDFRVTLHKGQ